MEKFGIVLVVLSLLSLTPFLIHLNTPYGPGLSFAFLIPGVIISTLGFIKNKMAQVVFPAWFYTVVFWLRKTLGFLILADLLWFSVKAALAGGPFFFILPMFFNVAIIFCLVLLISKRNGLFVGILLLLLALFYSFIPLIPGPTLNMEGMNLSELLIPSENQILFLSIFIAKCLTLISGVFLFISGFIKYPKKA